MNKVNSNDQVVINGVTFTHKDIATVVRLFYGKVAKDEVLKVPFASVHDWPDHIERLSNFWWTRFGGKAYVFSQYNPVVKHYHAGFNAELLKRWLSLFHETLEENLNLEQVKIWTEISTKMGNGFFIKNEMYKLHLQEKKD